MAVDWKAVLKSFKDKAIFRRWDINELTRNFFEGLFLLVPVVVTIVVVLAVFDVIDGWLNIPIPGVGFLVTIILITLAGRLASNVFFRGALGSLEKLLTRTPFIKLLYTSLKDLIEAFMGEKKRFDYPVMVTLTAGGQAIGFVTRHSMERFGLTDHVAVYFPQSYNFAGNVLVFSKDHIRHLDAESSEVMAFIVSGGVSGGANTSSDVLSNSDSHCFPEPSESHKISE